MHFIVMSHCQRHCIGVIKLSLERVSFEVEVISCKITHKYRLALNHCSFAFLTFFYRNKRYLSVINLSCFFLLGNISRYRDLTFLIDYWTIYWIIFFFNFVKRLRDSLKVSFQIYLINCSIYFLSPFFFHYQINARCNLSLLFFILNRIIHCSAKLRNHRRRDHAVRLSAISTHVHACVYMCVSCLCILPSPREGNIRFPHPFILFVSGYLRIENIDNSIYYINISSSCHNFYFTG